MKFADPYKDLTEEEAYKIREEYIKRCRETQKQKDEEAYMVKKELIPRYTLSG